MAAKKASKKTAAKATKTAKKAAKKAVKVKKGTAKRSSKKAKEEGPVFNVREHALVPQHEVMSEDEVAVFFEKRDIQPTNLPTIYISDPALKGLEVKMGDIIRITRNSRTANQSVFYRRVAYE